MAQRRIDIFIIVAAIILAVFAISSYRTGNNQTGGKTAPAASAEPGAGTQGAPSASSGMAVSAGGANVPPPAAPAHGAIWFSSPPPDAAWAIGDAHEISWNRAAGVTGEIYLADAATGRLVGCITPNTGGAQTSYSWDTRSVLLTCTSPLKKDVAPGDYELKAVFNGSVVGAASPAFKLIYAAQAQIPTYTLTFKNLALSPGSLTVAAKSKLEFVNDDTVAHTVKIGNITVATLAPGASYVFDTSPLPASTYNVYSEAYPAASSALTIQ